MRPEEVVGISEQEQAANARRLNCAALAGRAVTRVVHRVRDATETTNLDLSECDLMQVPDAVYHLLRNTRVSECNLANNDLSKIAIKFSHNFSALTALNLSFNHLGGLPDELSHCTQLQRLNISNNGFTFVPPVLFRLPSLAVLQAKKNLIADIQVDKFVTRPKIEELDFSENPLSVSSRRQVTTLLPALPEGRRLVVHLSPEEDEDDDMD